MSAGDLTLSFPAQAPKTGILLLAHGGSAEWNARVADVAAAVNASQATEVALGMASRAAIQGALDKLAARGVTDVVAVPLFVSSWSSVVTSTEYLLGLRAEAPADLATFAKMNHDATTEHGAHSADGASPVSTPLKIVTMAPSFNRHPLIGQIAVDRAAVISTSPEHEAVILVAHGPVPDDDNRLWLADLAVLADRIRASRPYASVDYMTVRDDAGPAIREAATAELRGKVSAQTAQDRRVLIVPHVMSFGGIEQGIRKRLEGLTFVMSPQGLMPDARVIDWVLLSAHHPAK